MTRCIFAPSCAQTTVSFRFCTLTQADPSGFAGELRKVRSSTKPSCSLVKGQMLERLRQPQSKEIVRNTLLLLHSTSPPSERYELGAAKLLSLPPLPFQLIQKPFYLRPPSSLSRHLPLRVPSSPAPVSACIGLMGVSWLCPCRRLPRRASTTERARKEPQ